MAMLNSDLVDRGEDDKDNFARHHGDDGSDGVSSSLLTARSDNDRGAQVPGGGGGQLLVASVEDPHQAPASQVPDGPLLVCSNVSPLGHIGYSVFLKHPK